MSIGMHKADDAASLEDLLRLQEQFQARSEAPAAKVTFVGGARRKAEIASKGDFLVSEASGSHHDTSTGEVESQEHEAAGDWVIVGDVMERVAEATQPPSIPTHPAAGGGFPLAKHRRQSRFALSRKAKHNADAPTETAAFQGEAAGAVAAADMAVSGAEADIDAENRAALQNMSPQEVEGAKLEIEDRLGPEKVAFLRKRAAQRAQQAAQKTEHHHTKSRGTEGLSPSLKATDSQGTWAPRNEAPAEVPRIHDAGAESELRPISRIRFSLSGEPVGWKSTVEEEAIPTSVVERDLLRQDEGTVSEGYTVQEMCQLARSSLPAQRAFACRHLAALLARARPSMADAYAVISGNCKNLKPIHVPGADQAPCCDWDYVWEHALKDCQVAVVLRVALDDSSQSVITEAAEALAALVALESIVPSGAYRTTSGLAMVPSRYLERPHVLSAWSVLPVDIPKPPEMPSTSQNAAEEELEQQLDERQVAAKDRLAGLLQMQVLARISYLLQDGVGPAAADSLLSILYATALGGDDMVSAICTTPGLVKALLAILDDAPPGESGHAVRPALHPARPVVLCVLRSLCQAGADVARHLLGQGLKAQVIRFVLGSGIAPIPANPTAFLMQIEAVCIWRICACYGLSVMSLDDAYPVLLPRLGVPEWASLLAPVVSSLDAETKLLASAEMLMTVAELLLHAGRAPDQAQVSPRCADALLQEAVAWLQPQPLQELLDYVIQKASVRGSGNDSGNFAAQAALLALAAVLEIVHACTLLPYMKDASSKAAALVADMSAHPEPQQSPQDTRQSQGSFVCKLLTFLKQLLGPPQDDGQPAPDLTQAKAGVVVATCEVLSGCLRTCHAADSAAGNALEQLAATLAFPRNAAELVSLQPSAAGAFQVQQAILNLVLTGVEHALQGPASGHAWQKMLDAVLRVPSLAPPGGEDLALRAMSCVLHGCCYSAVHERGTELLSTFSEGGSDFAVAAGMLGAWWQEGDAEVKANPLPELPSASAVREELLPAYTAHWLGLVPEGPPQSANAGGPPTAKMGAVQKQSLVRQPVGSRLPTPPDWMFGIEPVPAQVQLSAELDTISEEGEPLCTQQPEWSGRARIVGLGLLFLVALEVEPALPCMDQLPVGVKLRGLMDLVFSPTPLSSNGGVDASDALWLDPLIRWTTAALLVTYARHMPIDRLAGSITEADTARWAAHFATVSYGDALFASALALLLRPNMPEPVQVTMLGVLAEEGALHLLPPLHRAPSSKEAYLGLERPEAVTRLLAKLLEDGSLQKAQKSNSMVYDLAVESQNS